MPQPKDETIQSILRPKNSQLILGIDPGTAVTGFGFVIRDGNRFKPGPYGVWRTRREQSRGQRLHFLVRELDAMLLREKPDAVALELAFLGKNIQSALRLGEARGALLATCAGRQVTVIEYTTATVKKALVGNGRADKTQLQFMLQQLMAMPKPPSPLDASDALALAYTLALNWKFEAELKGQARPF